MALPEIAEFIPNSMVDWDGRLSSVLVLQGCNLRCPICHSARYVSNGPAENPAPWEDVESYLLTSAGWVDGIVVSGGEPTLAPGLLELLGELAAFGLPVKLDTNGTRPEVLKDALDAGLVAHVAMDVKAPLAADLYALACGAEAGAGETLLRAVRSSLDILRASGVSFELRTTLSPRVFQEEARLDALAAELAWAPKWLLQEFRPVGCLDPSMELLPRTPADWLRETALRLAEIAPGCSIRA